MYKTGTAYPGCTLTSEHPNHYSTVQCTKPAHHTLVVHRHQSILNNTVQYNLQRNDFLTKISNFWFYNLKTQTEFLNFYWRGVEKRNSYQKLSTGWNLLRGYIEQGRTWRTTTHHVVNVAMPEKKIESVTSLKPEPFFTTKIIKQLSSF